jgi:transcriptional regulator
MKAMYIPPDFQVPPTRIQEFLDRYGFGAWVTRQEGSLVATHLPFLFRPSEGPSGTLVAHLARANRQWTTLEGPEETLVIFQGPHAYVSPAWYEVHPSVPTWNYAVVHAYGIPSLITEEPEVRTVLRELVQKYDPAWAMDVPDDYLSRMIRQIVAFKIRVTRLEGKFKISQNRPAPDRESVERELARSPDPMAREVAGVMRAVRLGQPLPDA